MLIQMDGSHHRWLADNGRPCILLLAVDGDTDAVVNALFYDQENNRNYFLLMQNLLRCPDPAFRPLPSDLRLRQVLRFKHRRRVGSDNTVKFQRDTLQLLPGRRRSYARAVVLVLQGLDGRRSLQHKGRIIAARKAPPSPRSLRNGVKPPAGDAIQSPSPKASLNLGKRRRATDDGRRRKRSRVRHRR